VVDGELLATLDLEATLDVVEKDLGSICESRYQFELRDADSPWVLTSRQEAERLELRQPSHSPAQEMKRNRDEVDTFDIPATNRKDTVSFTFPESRLIR